MPQDIADAIRVPLGKSNRVALIDPVDAVLIVQYRWYRSTNGYAVTFIHQDGQSPYQVGMHRILMDMERGDGLEVDHINLDRLDNRRCNLRITTRAENDQNRPYGRPLTSAYRNVSWNKDRWRACISINDKQINLGRYDNELAAARAAEAARRAHMPFAIPVVELDPIPPCPCATCDPTRIRQGRLTDEQREAIVAAPAGDSHEVVAERFGVSKSYAQKLRLGKLPARRAA